jgi:hypothetical protein
MTSSGEEHGEVALVERLHEAATVSASGGDQPPQGCPFLGAGKTSDHISTDRSCSCRIINVTLLHGPCGATLLIILSQSEAICRSWVEEN